MPFDFSKEKSFTFSPIFSFVNKVPESIVTDSCITTRASFAEQVGEFSFWRYQRNVTTGSVIEHFQLQLSWVELGLDNRTEMVNAISPVDFIIVSSLSQRQPETRFIIESWLNSK
jgi:hypothetical protein